MDSTRRQIARVWLVGAVLVRVRLIGIILNGVIRETRIVIRNSDGRSGDISIQTFTQTIVTGFDVICFFFAGSPIIWFNIVRITASNIIIIDSSVSSIVITRVITNTHEIV